MSHRVMVDRRRGLPLFAGSLEDTLLAHSLSASTTLPWHEAGSVEDKGDSGT